LDASSVHIFTGLSAVPLPDEPAGADAGPLRGEPATGADAPPEPVTPAPEDPAGPLTVPVTLPWPVDVGPGVVKATAPAVAAPAVTIPASDQATTLRVSK
jgi:hypothetical protein